MYGVPSDQCYASSGRHRKWNRDLRLLHLLASRIIKVLKRGGRDGLRAVNRLTGQLSQPSPTDLVPLGEPTNKQPGLHTRAQTTSDVFITTNDYSDNKVEVKWASNL